MGEAPAFCSEDLRKEIPNGFGLKSKSSTLIGDKTYLVGGKDDESTSSVEVQIFIRSAGSTESTGQWVTPVVLGTKPKTCESHHAVPVGEDRILIIRKGCKPDDCLWFLEVDTQYVRKQKKIYEQKEIYGTEVVAWSKGVRGNAEKPVVISGPSGVGKGTLISKLMAEYPSSFGFSVSYTTRAPREMEKDGVHYHFTEKSVMEKDIEDGKFLEFASVHGNLYGTSIETVEAVADEGKRCILDIDVQGARSVRASTLEAIFIFICPPSMEELEKRLRARGTETEEQISKRLENAKAELEQGMSSDLFDHILYNDNLEECYKKLKKLLGLDGNVGLNPQPPCRGLHLPSEFSVSKADNRIIISFENAGSEKSYNDQGRIVLDVSSLKGGAPGRTRGLEPILH